MNTETQAGDNALMEIEAAVDSYVGGVIQNADIPQEDKDAIAADLLDLQERLVRNGLVKAHLFAGVAAKVLLGHLGL